MKILIHATIYEVQYNLVVNAGYVSVNLLLEATYNGYNLFLLQAFYKMLSRELSKKKKKKNRALFYLGVALNYYNLLLPAIYYIVSSYDVFVMPTNCCLN